MSEWVGSVNVDGLRVASCDGDEKDFVFNTTMYYASQYVEEVEKRVTITIQKRKDKKDK